MNIYPITYIISAYTNSADFAKNQHNNDLLRTMLTQLGFGVKQVDGVWENMREKSFVVVGASDESILSLARVFRQDAVLKLHNDRHAELLYRDGRVEPLGRFIATDRATALEHDGYTYDPTTNTFYIVVGEE